MMSSLGTNYLLPAVLLNPVLFLHSLNTILSRIITPITVEAAVQPPPYSQLGPSANHPHIDMRQHDNLCWSYTMVMVCAQLVVFGRVNRNRERMRESKDQKNTSIAESRPQDETTRSTETQHSSPIAVRDTPTEGSKEIRFLTKHATKPARVMNGHFVAPERVEWEILR